MMNSHTNHDTQKQTRKNLCCLLFGFVFWSLLIPGWAGKTVMKNGTWISNTTPLLAQADIDGRTESVCLPKLEYTDAIDGAQLQKKMKEEIHRQGAIFHLIQDGLGSPIKKNGMFFATDVYLKDLKMTFSDTLRSWGYNFQVSSKPAFEDPTFMNQVQSGAMAASHADKPSGKKPEEDKDKKTKVKTPSTGSLDGLGYSDVLPAGLFSSSSRKMKQELEKKIREIKSRPFKSEVLKVDVVRWASGQMGILDDQGQITNASIEGNQVTCKITPPKEKSWLTPELFREVASQSCEFVLQRDQFGQEARKNSTYVLADIYFTDLALTWDEWLTSHKLTPRPRTPDPTLATQPITLQVKGVEGTCKALKSLNTCTLTLLPSDLGPGGEETVRLPPFEKGVKNFKDFTAKLKEKIAGKTVTVSLILGADGKPYLELGQKRVSRIYFPDQKTTLMILMKDLCGEEK